jgi:hypothetical protein
VDDMHMHTKDSLKRARSSAAPPEPAFERLERRRERKHRNARIGSAAVALAVVAGIVAGGVWTLEHRSTRTIPGGSGPTAAPTGPTGAPAVSLQAGPGQYYYWKTVRPMPDGNVVEQIWWGQDGSGRYQVDSTNPNYGPPKSQEWGPGAYQPFGFPFDSDLSGLSSDPATLLQQMLDRSSSTGASPEPEVTLSPGLSPETSRMWRSIQELIEQGNATAPVRAALFDVASVLDGVQVQQDTVDPLGRPAIAVSVQLGDYYCGGTDTMWFDPQTHLLLASDGDLGCSPSVLVVAGGIVDSTSQTVAPGDGFIPPPAQPIPAAATPTEGTEGHTAPAPAPSSATST